jgi:hypothetical protein
VKTTMPSSMLRARTTRISLIPQKPRRPPNPTALYPVLARPYSAFMKSLTAAHQPDRAYSILKKEMPRVGVKVTSVHYAIVMAGFIETGQLGKVFQVQNMMLNCCIKQSMSTRLLVLKARVKAAFLRPDPQDVKLEKVEHAGNL